MKPVYPRGSTTPVTPWVPTTKQNMSQELSDTNHCRQQPLYQSLRAAAAVSVMVISLHAEGMWTSAMTECITLYCLTGLNLQVCNWETSWAAVWGEGGSYDHVVVSWKRASAELFLRIIQHSLEESLLPVCKALLLATQG